MTTRQIQEKLPNRGGKQEWKRALAFSLADYQERHPSVSVSDPWHGYSDEAKLREIRIQLGFYLRSYQIPPVQYGAENGNTFKR